MIGQPRRSRVGRGFTLVELVVVIVIVAILAGVVTPRLVRSADRRVESEAWRVESVVSGAVSLTRTANAPVAVEYDSQSARLAVSVQERDEDGGVAWRHDVLTPGVWFEDGEIVSAVVDGRGLRGSGWRVVLRDLPYPTLSLLVRRAGAADGPAWQVDLVETGEVRVRSAGRGAATVTPSAPVGVDLDKSGRTTDPW